MKYNEKLKKRTNTARVIVAGFALVIIIGALLLTLPLSNADGQREGLLTCLFTSVSATCVTGLVVVDTALHWSIFGQAVILILIQIGGLGFMTMAVALSMLVRRAISPKERLILAQSVNLNSVSGMVKLTKRIIYGTFIFEALGAVVLMLRFVPLMGTRGIWKAVFTSVSAFCNAGFDLMGDYSGEFSSLTALSGDAAVCITVMLLILVGGIGFIVWDDVIQRIREGRRLSVYTKVVLTFSAALVIIGTAAILITEWGNPATLGEMSVGRKLLNAAFQAVTPRTAGFNTLDYTGMNDITELLTIMLMFIGGCSGSTAGGIKVGTFGVAVLTIVSVLHGHTDITAFGRRIHKSDILRAFSIIAVQLIATLAVALVLIGGGTGVMRSMFEAFSASGTVGLSMGLTPTLGVIQLASLAVLMFFGRVGILTISCATMLKISQTNREFKNADAKMIIG